MNKIKFIATLLLAILFVAGCKDGRVDDLIKKIDDFETRLKTLENTVNNANNEITTLKGLIDAVNKKVSVVSYKELPDGGGYELTMSDDTKLVLKNGKTPAVNVKQHTDGKLYWTLDGEFMRDADNNMIPAEGEAAPQLRINATSNFWEISSDGGKTWQEMKNSDGKPVTATGEDGDADLTITETEYEMTIVYKGVTYVMHKVDQGIPVIEKITAKEGKNQHVGDNSAITVPLWECTTHIVMLGNSQRAEISTTDNWITVTKDGNNFIAEFAANTGIQRTGAITIKNAVDSEKFVTVSVTQFKYSSSMITRFAKLNVGTLNKFTNDKETDNNATLEEQQDPNGTMLYQFGRNVPFVFGNYSANAANRVQTPADSKEESRFIRSQGDYARYWHNDGKATDTWASIAQAIGDGAGVGTNKIGNNDGDPCPPGYRLPSQVEYNTLFFGRNILNFTNTRDHSEELSPAFDGNVQSYKSDYKILIKEEEENVRIQFALKMKETEYAEAVRYEFLPNNILKVTAKKVSITATIDEVANEDFFADADDSVYFPSTGRIQGDYASGLDRAMGSYWAHHATALWDKQAGRFTFQSQYFNMMVGGEFRADALALRCVRK